jgi:hypothetical protein
METLKELRHTEAVKRNEAWNKLSPAQQLAELDKRLGVGIGAAKQRAKIAALLEKHQAKVVATALKEQQIVSKSQAKRIATLKEEK